MSECKTEGIAKGVTVAHSNTCVLIINNKIKCFGLNHYGNLGIESTESKGASLSDMGDNLAYAKLGSSRTATKVSAGGTHVCALLDNGKVKCWGENLFGAVGLDAYTNRATVGDEPNSMGDELDYVAFGADNNNRVIDIETGTDHNCAIMENNNLYCWGSNNFGQLGMEHTHDLGDEDGEMSHLAPVRLGEGRQATQISLGYGHTCAILHPSRSVACWGLNYHGQLGIGSNEDVGWKSGQMGDQLKEAYLGTGAKVKQVAAGEGFTCAVLDEGDIKCFGLNTSGQLGLGHSNNVGGDASELGDALPSVSLPTDVRVAKVATGAMHTCVLGTNAQVYCWGDNTWGQLGVGDTRRRGIQPSDMGNSLAAVPLAQDALELSVGDFHSCAVLQDGSLKCWGRNEWGYLGLGDRNSRGDQPGEMGGALPAVSLRCHEDVFAPAPAPTSAPTRRQDENTAPTAPPGTSVGGDTVPMDMTGVGLVVGLVVLVALVVLGVAIRKRRTRNPLEEALQDPSDESLDSSDGNTAASPTALTQV